MAELAQRIVRAVKLDPALYEEVEADKNALGQAMGVGGAIVSLIGWFVWAFLTYSIGTRILPEPQTQADLGQLLRTTGFASAPGIIRIFGLIPGLGPLVFFVAMIWMLVAMVISVRQALDYTSTFRAVGVCVMGWLVQVLIIFILFAMMGVPIATIEA